MCSEPDAIPRVTSGKHPISGNRIVDLTYVLNKTIDLQYDHSKKCTTGKLLIKKEIGRGKGLVSIIEFECDMCKTTLSLHTENPEKVSVINTGAVWGALATGSSYEYLSELLACMDVPQMNKRTFYQLEEELGEVSDSTVILL